VSSEQKNPTDNYCLLFRKVNVAKTFHRLG